MTTSRLRQLAIALTVLAVGAVMRFAPYEYWGYDEIARLQNGQSVERAPVISGLVYAPLWSTPTSEQVLASLPVDDAARIQISRVALSHARVGSYLAIVLVLLVLAVATANPQAAKTPRASSTVR